MASGGQQGGGKAHLQAPGGWPGRCPGVFPRAHGLDSSGTEGVRSEVGGVNSGRSKDVLSERMGWSPQGLQEARRPGPPSPGGDYWESSAHSGTSGPGRMPLGPSRREILGGSLLRVLNSSPAPSGERGRESLHLGAQFNVSSGRVGVTGMCRGPAPASETVRRTQEAAPWPEGAGSLPGPVAGSLWMCGPSLTPHPVSAANTDHPLLAIPPAWT